MRYRKRIAISQGFATVHVEGPKKAPTVVVVPALGMPGGVLDPFVARLSARLRVAVVELPGAGAASEAPPWVSTRALAESLARVVARLGAGKCHLFGLSLGGMVAQWMAIDGAAGLDRLVLASTAARGCDLILTGPLEKLSIAAHVAAGRSVQVSLAEAVVSPEVRTDAAEMERIAVEIEEAPRDLSELAWLVAAVLRHDTREHLSKITLPTLILSGEHDELVPTTAQDELAAGIVGAQRALIDGAGHAVTLDQPEACASVVEAFLLEAPLKRGTTRAETSA